jgi:recombination endonuclease VII
MGWRPTTIPGRPPKCCVNCLADDPGLAEAPNRWRPTDHAPRAPRCATHQRAHHNAGRQTSRDSYQTRTYGLSPEEHSDLLAFQGGVCAVCLFANGTTKALASDHDHSCCSGPTSCGGCVRGKLCGPDNKDLIGRIELIAKRNNERPTDVLLRIIGYFEDPPMARMRRLQVRPA